jgi:hypothetical protein
MVQITVRNTGTPLGPRRLVSEGHLGLRRIEQRLRCHYGNRGALTLGRAADGSTVAELLLPSLGSGGNTESVAAREPA